MHPRASFGRYRYPPFIPSYETYRHSPPRPYSGTYGHFPLGPYSGIPYNRMPRPFGYPQPMHRPEHGLSVRSRGNGIWIFLDDSNLWIEAKKVKGYKLNKAFTEDPRLRIDVGRLAELISSGRTINDAILYGSEPPPIDTVWKEIEKRGWKIKKHRKSERTGKEKKVDTQIVADITELVCESKNYQLGSTVVLISGDNDMTPCIEKAISKRWDVEVWAMEKGLGGDLRRLKKDYPEQITVKCLSDSEHLDQFTFTNERYSITPQKEEDMVKRGLVLVNCCKELLEENENEFGKLKKVMDGLKWPWQFARLVDKKSSSIDSQELVVIFCYSHKYSEDGSENDPLISSMPVLKTHCIPNLCESIVTYFEYNQKRRQTERENAFDLCWRNQFTALHRLEETSDTTVSGAFESEDIALVGVTEQKYGESDVSSEGTVPVNPNEQNLQESGLSSEAEMNSDIGNASPDEEIGTATTEKTDHGKQNEYKDTTNGFQYVKHKIQKSHQLYTDKCRYRFQCLEGRRCKYSHTLEEKNFFRQREMYGDKNAYKYKTSMCNKLATTSHCPFGKKCIFAHCRSELICCKCHLLGHSSEQCNC